MKNMHLRKIQCKNNIYLKCSLSSSFEQRTVSVKNGFKVNVNISNFGQFWKSFFLKFIGILSPIFFKKFYNRPHPFKTSFLKHGRFHQFVKNCVHIGRLFFGKHIPSYVIIQNLIHRFWHNTNAHVGQHSVMRKFTFLGQFFAVFHDTST